MNAFRASENRDRFIVLRSPQPWQLRAKLYPKTISFLGSDHDEAAPPPTPTTAALPIVVSGEGEAWPAVPTICYVFLL